MRHSAQCPVNGSFNSIRSWLVMLSGRSFLAVSVVLLSLPSAAAEESTLRSVIVDRVRSDIEFLASDELEGRGIDTPGIEKAAGHILAEYERLGLQPGMPDGSWRQPFTVDMGDVVITESTGVRITGPDGTVMNLETGKQFQPIRRGRNGQAAGGLTFIGYGISSEEDNYDDYAGLDVEGRILVMIRREPRQGVEGEVFKGIETSSHSYIDRKLELVNRAKAAGVIFVNDPYSSPSKDKDELTPPAGFGSDGNSVPFVHVRQMVIDQILQTTPLRVDGRELKSLAAVSDFIDESLQPISQELPGWTADVTTEFQVNSVTTDNLIGVIEGEGPLADQTIIIGGHYDHIGYGGFGSRTPNRRGEIHNGADDNASGTSAVLEIARRIAAGPKPRRRMVFICFSAEERGLIGSNYYVRNPVFPLDNTIFMLNFDMIGNLRNNRVEVNGVGSGAEFADIVRDVSRNSPLSVSIVENPFGGSDHLPFYQRKIPVLFCFTGLTSTYHTPDDTFASLNIEGTVSVIDFSEQLLLAVDRMDSPPTFQEVSRTRRPRPGRIPYLGIAPELSDYDGEGVMVRTVRPDSPAEAAGIQVGDVILKMGDQPVEVFQTMTEILTRSKAGDKLKVVLRRGEDEIETLVELGAPPG